MAQDVTLTTNGKTVATLDSSGPENVGKPEIRLSVGSFAQVNAADHPVPNSQRIIGFSGITVNDNTAQPQSVYGIYGEARRVAGAGPAQASEFNALNGDPTSAPSDLDPYSPFGGVTTSSWMTCGRTDLPAFPGSCSAVFPVVNNGAYFRRGIVFRSGALDPNGPLDAIAMPTGAFLSWYGDTNSKVSDVVGAKRGTSSGQVSLRARNDAQTMIDVSLHGHGNNSFAPSGAIDLGAFASRWNTMYAANINLTQNTPASSSATCATGQIWADASYIYVCAATNTIKRAALTSF